MSDLKFALRRLSASPIFTTFAVVSLALGIGATTAIYSVVRLVLSPPQGVPNLERVVHVAGRQDFSVPDFEDFHARQTACERVTAWRFFSAALAANGQALTSHGEMVSGDYFHVLGVTPATGRLLQPADDRPGAPFVTVISDLLSRRLFAGGDPLGRDIKISGERFEIVGVVPASFRGLNANGLVPGSVWVPLATSEALARSGSAFRSRARDARWLTVRALLPPGQAIDRAAAEAVGIGAQLEREQPTSERRPRQWNVTRMADAKLLDGDAWLVNGLVAAVMTAVGAVLLIACSNLANLMLARSSRRRAEIAVQLALGASRAQLVRSALVDSAVLAIAGGLAGIAVARYILVSLSGEFALIGTAGTILFEPRLDIAVFAVAAAATILTMAVIGMAPVLQSARADVRGVLTDAASGAIHRSRGRRLLIAVQITASVVLLSIAALAHSQLRAATSGGTGLDLERLAIASVDFADQRYDSDRAGQIAGAVVAGLERHPGIAAAAVSTGLPLGEGLRAPSGRLRVDAASLARGASIVAASPGILTALGVNLVHGRTWTPIDVRPIVVNRSIAVELFGTEHALGRTVELQRPTYGQDQPFEAHTVIGVAADTDTGYAGRRDPTRGVAYVPMPAAPTSTLIFSAQARDDADAGGRAIRETIAAVDPDVAVRMSGAAAGFVGFNQQFFEIAGGVSRLLGSLAWVLALIGLYGVLSNVVLARTREIGVRVALGASPAAIIRMILFEGLLPVGFGVIGGLALGVLARQALQPGFQRIIPPLDVAVLAVAPVMFLLVALFACYLPARRASRIDPNVALRVS